MDEKKQEAIVLLNDGEQSSKDVHCNSWPSWVEYIESSTYLLPPCNYDPQSSN